MGRLQRKKTSIKKKKPSVESAAGEKRDHKISASLPAGSTKKTKSLTRTKSKNVTRAEPDGRKKSYLDKALQFLREVKVELKKVTWPSRKQTIGSTAVVIMLVIIISFFLGVVDLGLSRLVSVIF